MSRRSKARSLSIAIRQSPVFSSIIESPDDTSAFASAISTATGGEIGSGGSEAVATAADLPLSGNEVGDFAFVEETNRLYIWNGNGWYNIALVNETPSFTLTSDSSYDLAKDGTPTIINLAATDPEDVPIQWDYTVTQGSIVNNGGSTVTIEESDGTFTITPTTNADHGGEFTLAFTGTDGVNTIASTSSFKLDFAEPGGVLYETPGTYSWTAPLGINSVCVVCVGAGGNGTKSGYRVRGGAGGGLGWKNNIPVVPGQTYTLVVGGSASYFIDTSTVAGYKGANGFSSLNDTSIAAGGSFVGDGGGNGGSGTYNFYATGGGGAGGYSGDGGNSGNSGSGGGGAGGYTQSSTSSNSSGGGGVGVYGEGPSGTSSGAGGSGGGNNRTQSDGKPSVGGIYGGGGGSHATSTGADYRGAGGPGAVRIIWGDGRAFPSTNVDLASSTAGETTI